MSLITPNYFIHTPEGPPTDEPPITIFFITGNPGLIGYYHTFLSLLSSKLAAFIPDTRFQIYGHSLSGFELDDSTLGTTQAPKAELGTTEAKGSDDYYDVDGQISFVHRRLDEFLITHSDGNKAGKRPKVILMGHSLGTYIAMEVLRRHRERQKAAAATATSATAEVEFDIIGGIMLFPTVVDIAKSPSGRKLNILLYLIPQLALVVSLFARILTALLPASILRALVATFMRFKSASEPDDTVLDTTCGFLQSKRGVRQAVHLATSEMQAITSDKWADDVWGIPKVREPLAKLFFYFGRNDHWVAERTRDEIIAARGRSDGPTMVVCEEGLPHAFCLRHNGVMARKAADMIQGIVEGRK